MFFFYFVDFGMTKALSKKHFVIPFLIGNGLLYGVIVAYDRAYPF